MVDLQKKIFEAKVAGVAPRPMPVPIAIGQVKDQDDNPSDDESNKPEAMRVSLMEAITC